MNENMKIPYSFMIKNLTDDKFYDVDIFNYDHKNQKNIEYHCLNGISYDTFLRRLSAITKSEEEIEFVRILVSCDYPKFRRKQLISSIFTSYVKKNGSALHTPAPTGLFLDVYQQQSDMIDMSLNEQMFKGNKILLSNELQLTLAYLMPEATVTITLYPKLISNQ
jgi:hypothetical protein